MAKKPVLARFGPELFAALSRVAAARKRKWGELVRLYAEKAIAADIERLDRGESLDDLTGSDTTPDPQPPKPKSGKHASFKTGPTKGRAAGGER